MTRAIPQHAVSPVAACRSTHAENLPRAVPPSKATGLALPQTACALKAAKHGPRQRSLFFRQGSAAVRRSSAGKEGRQSLLKCHA